MVKRIKITFKQLDLFTLLIKIFLFILSLSIVMLLFWAITTSLKSQNVFRVNPFGLLAGWPWEWEWNNYVKIFQHFSVPVVIEGVPYNIGVGQQLINTLIYCFTGAFMSTMVPCLVAYATSKFNFKYNAVLDTIVILTLIIPIVGNTASTMQILKFFGLYDNIWLNLVTQFNFLGIYYFVFKAAFKGISEDYRDAAYIDGASEFKVLVKIMLPMVSKVVFTVFMLKFISFWEDYQTPLLYVPNHPTIAYGVFYLSNSNINGLNVVPVRLAGCMIMAIPIITIYIIFRNQLIGKVSMGGLKE
ncbi:MAG: carbohydrate ABC transporter permease [Clostridia bacterium]|nr:carbohydrate ABC transporter permease [Clostridia bacterium]